MQGPADPTRPLDPTAPPGPAVLPVATLAGEPAAAPAAGPLPNGEAAPVVAVAASGDARIDGLIAGMAWAAGSVSYADPYARADYGDAYPGFLLRDFQRLAPAQSAALHAALAGEGAALAASVAGFTGLGMVYAGRGGDAVIRVGNSSAPSGAFAYYPAADITGGDVFFNGSGRAPLVGNLDYATILHELGHALGLKHGHEATGFGALPQAWDSMEFSTMTYRSHVGGGVGAYTNETFGFPQTWMMLDIAALQRLYGASYTANAGDTVYSWDPATGAHAIDGAVVLRPGENRIFQTIWDGGGVDAYDLSAYATDLRLDLHPGGHSVLSAAQLAFLGGGETGYARGNVFNALLFGDDPRSLIENALGGAGDDVIAGNAAGNALAGGAGDDAISGGKGADMLSGGAGADALTGGTGADVLDGGAGADRMDGGPGDDVYRIDDAGDVAAEPGGSGRDRVIAGVSHRLGEGIELLTLSAPGQGRGNGLDNLLIGSDGGDVLIGGKGADVLRGRGGDDALLGELGADELRGGAGADRFVFHLAAWSTEAAFDVIAPEGATRAMEGVGAAGGDVVDLSRIDADVTKPGDQAFVWGGAGLGGLVLVDAGDGATRVLGRTGAGAEPEFRIDILDGAGVSAATYAPQDFVL